MSTQDEALAGYARDPRNYRRVLQEPEPEVETEVQPPPTTQKQKKQKK